jgi:transposase InsO family protein
VNVYPFIEAEKQEQRNVKRACELLQVSRAAYYAARDGQPSRRDQDDAELTEAIKQAHADSKRRYGAPRIHAELRRRGRRHGRKRIARLMRQAKIRGRTPKRWKKTTIPDPAAAARADLVRRDFTANASAINSRWCGDITYLPTWEGWLFLATVIDIASRRVVGFAMADHLRTDLVADALANAIAARNPDAGVIFHSDRGCQYTSREYATLAADLNVQLSVGRTGQCWDNALAESFFASLKGECLDQQAWPTRTSARRAIVDHIAWFNGTRLHSALGYLTPNEFERYREGGVSEGSLTKPSTLSVEAGQPQYPPPGNVRTVLLISAASSTRYPTAAYRRPAVAPEQLAISRHCPRHIRALSAGPLRPSGATIEPCCAA